MNPILGLNVIVAVGSVDGMAGAAACLRIANDPTIQVVFTQAFQVNDIDMSKWPSKSKVGFIDLGVNNDSGNESYFSQTRTFVNRIYELGHKILFIADEHGKKAWQTTLTSCGRNAKELSIRPKDRDKYGSSCDILLKKLDKFLDFHSRGLLEAGSQGDKMNFNTYFGKIFNEGVKSNMSDPARRPYLVKHMAENQSPDGRIKAWMAEYAEIASNSDKILESGMDLGGGIFMCDGSHNRHDATVIFKKAYERSSIVVLINEPRASIATNNEGMNILQIIQQANISASGMPAKANFEFKDLNRVINVIRAKTFYN